MKKMKLLCPINLKTYQTVLEYKDDSVLFASWQEVNEVIFTIIHTA